MYAEKKACCLLNEREERPSLPTLHEWDTALERYGGERE